MANIGLVIDPIAQDSANSPLPLVSADNGVRVFSFDAPTPELESQWASSSDTEGEARAGYRYRNRTITVGVQVQEPTDAAATNLVTNPKMAVGTTGWTNTSMATFARALLSDAAIDSPLPAVDTALHVVGDADLDQGNTSFAVTNGLTYAVSVYVRLMSLSATQLRVLVANAGGTTKASANISTLGVWTRLTMTFVADTTATWTVRVVQVGAGAVDGYVTAFQVEQASVVSAYFDGDTPGAYWNGTINASTSTRQAPGGDRFNAIINDLQQKTAKLTREGGTLRLAYANGDTITCDVLEASLPAVPFDQFLIDGEVARIPATFTCKPFGRGSEIQLADHTETTLPVLVFTETTVKGDVPGTVKIQIDDDSANAQQTVLWGLRSRYYDPAATAALFLQAESLTPENGAATAVGTATASGAASNVVKQATLGTTSASMLTTGSLTHVGSYRVFARVLVPATNTGTVTIGFRWLASNFATTVNDTVALDPANEGFWLLVDLGQIRIPQMTVGTHGWTGYLYASSTVAADDLEVDWLLLLPVDEGWGQVTGGGFNAALSASASLHLSSDGKAVSQNGSTWRRAHKYEGDYPLLPPAGREGRTTQIAIKAARNAMSGGVAADAGIDDISARLTYVPRYLVVPKP